MTMTACRHCGQDAGVISMTWPQYLRHECKVGDFVVGLSRRETEALFVLLVRYPAPVRNAELLGAVYLDPDAEPDRPELQIEQIVRRLARKLGQYRIACSHGFGWRLVQRPQDAWKRAA